MTILRSARSAVLAFAMIAALAIGVAGVDAQNGAGGVTGAAFYVDGVSYRTVNTPTDLSGTGAPLDSFDVIYMIPNQSLNVAAAAPGYPDYNGGRWMVHLIAFEGEGGYVGALAAFDSNGSGDFDSAAEVEAAIAAGAATDTGVVDSFVCPVIKLK